MASVQQGPARQPGSQAVVAGIPGSHCQVLSGAPLRERLRAHRLPAAGLAGVGLAGVGLYMAALCMPAGAAGVLPGSGARPAGVLAATGMLAGGQDARAGQPVAPALRREALVTPRAGHAVLQAAARAGQRLVAVGERGVLLVSEDEGGHWRQIVLPTSVALTAVSFADARHGWVAGHGGSILASQDGGLHWTRQLDGAQAARMLLEQAQGSGSPPAIAEARRLVEEGADKPFLDILFTDTRHGWAVGAYNLAFRTADGGASWEPVSARLPNPGALHLYAVRVLGQTVLIAGEQGLVMVSHDEGRSFQRLSVPYAGSWFAAELLGPQDFLVAGLRGNVWRSQDGGMSWGQVRGGPPVNITASTRDAGGKVLLANQMGMVLMLEDDSLRPVAEHLPALNGLLALAPGRCLGLSFTGALAVPCKVETGSAS